MFFVQEDGRVEKTEGSGGEGRVGRRGGGGRWVGSGFRSPGLVKEVG